MQCNNCQTEKTPMWRKTQDSSSGSPLILCNACGLYYKSKGYHRPTVQISKKSSLSTSQLLDKLIQSKTLKNENTIVVKDLNIKDLNIIHCANCQNINTSIWRKDAQGRNICNACGLYFKKKGYHRVYKADIERASDNTDKEVFLEIDNNLVRFNRIKRRKRSSSSASSGSSTSSPPMGGTEKVSGQPFKIATASQRNTAVSEETSTDRTIVASQADRLGASSGKVSYDHGVVDNNPVKPLIMKEYSAFSFPLSALTPSNYTFATSDSRRRSCSIDQYHYDGTATSSSISVDSLAESTRAPLVTPTSKLHSMENVKLPSIRSILNNT